MVYGKADDLKGYYFHFSFALPPDTCLKWVGAKTFLTVKINFSLKEI